MKWEIFKKNVKAWLTFAPTSRPRKGLKKFLFFIENIIHKYPKIENIIFNFLNKYPIIKEKLLNVKENSIHIQPYVNRIDTIVQLSSGSREIYYAMKNNTNTKDDKCVLP